MTTYIVIYSIVAIFLVFSIIKDKNKTKKAFHVAFKAAKNTAPSLLFILGLVGLTLGILTPTTIERFLGEQAGLFATAAAGFMGTIMLIPSLIAFPLAGSLLRSGAGIMTISIFITTLVMVGFVTAPMELRILGKRFTLLRNGLAIVGAVVIAIMMGVFL